MKNKLSKIIATITDFDVTRTVMSLRFSGYLHEVGWIDSYKKKSPVNANNNPIPWVTYSFTEFISPRLQNNFDVFEFGSGNSTLFYASKVNSITTVEHDKTWYDHIYGQMPGNVKLQYTNLDYDGAYCRTAIASNKKYDLIIIDGRDRVNCAIQSIGALKENGVVVIDDSEREDYKAGVAFLIKNGYKSIDFWGLAPGVLNNKSTSVYYKANNCLNI